MKREGKGKFQYSKDTGEVEFRRLLTLEQATISDYKVQCLHCTLLPRAIYLSQVIKQLETQLRIRYPGS